MNWKELLASEIEYTYGVTNSLMNLTDDGHLAWKPSTGSNWMTTGQLLMHITNACGAPICGFVTGDWGMPEGMDVSDLSPEEMLPPAEKLPTVGSVAQVRLVGGQRYNREHLDRVCDIVERVVDYRLIQVAWPAAVIFHCPAGRVGRLGK